MLTLTCQGCHSPGWTALMRAVQGQCLKYPSKYQIEGFFRTKILYLWSYPMWGQQSQTVTFCTQDLFSHHVRAELLLLFRSASSCVKHQMPNRPNRPNRPNITIISQNITSIQKITELRSCSMPSLVAASGLWWQGGHLRLRRLQRLRSHWHICEAKILRAPTVLLSRRGPGFLHRPTECCLNAGTKTPVTLLPAYV